MGLSLELRLTQHLGMTVLSQRQILKLQQLMTIRPPKHPKFSDAAKGMDGIRAAHKILIERNAFGVLTGGIAESLWKRNCTPEKLAKHNDVDVIVLNEDFKLKQAFEGGIDWWLPHRVFTDIPYPSGGVTKDHRLEWWTNGYGTVLHYGVSCVDKREPGLYLMDPEWLLTMRRTEAEAIAKINHPKVSFDIEVIESFEARKRKTFVDCPPNFFIEEFAQYIKHPVNGLLNSRRLVLYTDPIEPPMMRLIKKMSGGHKGSERT